MQDDDIKEVKSDVKEIKVEVLKLVTQGAVHNALLKEHERRSLALETKTELLEKPVLRHEQIFKFLGAGAVLLLAEIVTRLLFK